MKKSEIVKKLKEVRALLTPRKNWTQKAWGRDTNGASVINIQRDKAVCYCLVGACYKATENDEDAFVLEKKLNSVLPKGFVSAIAYNDNRSHRSVLKLIDKAIAAK